MKALGSLSDIGWVTDPQILIAKLIEYYLYTDGSQSTMYSEYLTNLPRTYHENINRPEAMASQIRDDMETILGRYFESFEVETHVEHIHEEDYAISLYATAVSETGERVNAGVALTNNTAGVKDSVAIMNQGHGLRYIKNIVRKQ